MMIRFANAALIAAASVLTVAPVAAQAAPPQIERASEQAEGENLRGGYLLPLAIIIAIIIGVLLLSDDDEHSVSS